MNYLAHTFVAEGGSPEFIYGSVAPDLVGISGARIFRFKHEFGREVFMSEPDREVQAGIDFHYLTDRIFDSQIVFKALKTHFLEDIAPKYFGEDFSPSRGIADFGTELLIDGFLMTARPDIVRTYRDVLLGLSDLAVMSAARGGKRALLQTVNRYRNGTPDYTSPTEIAEILYRRTRGYRHLEFDQSRVPPLSRAIGCHQKVVAEFAPQLIEDTKRDARREAGLKAAKVALL